MRVMHVMASGERGGGLDHLRGLLPELERRGVASSVVIGPGGPGGEVLRGMGIPVTYVDLMRARVDPFAAARLMRVVRAAAADLVHYHGTRAGFFGALARSGLGSRTPRGVYTAHGLSHRKTGSRAERQLFAGVEALICRSVDHVVTVAGGDLDELRARRMVPAGGGTHVPNAVDAARFAPGAKESARARLPVPRSSAPSLWVGTVARLVPQKAVGDLLAAAALLDESVRLIVVGDGPQRPELETQARRLGIDGRTVFAGERADVEDLLRALDVFVLPSHWEGEPLALLEAMATGLPCVATSTGGAREALDGTGVLVPIGDPAALAEAIRSLGADPTRRARLGARARERAVARTWASSAEAHLQIYRRALTS